MLLGYLLIFPAILSGIFCWSTGAFENDTWLWLLPVGYVGGFLAALILFLAVVLVSGLLVDRDKPQEKDSKYYRFLIARVSEFAKLLLSAKVHTEGLEKMPQSGRFLLVCNHLAEVDPLLLMGCLHKTGITFVSKRENRDRFMIGQYMHKIRCPLMNRENDREALKTILKCIEIIKEDKASIAVFPEGGILGGNVLHPFRGGVFKIALRTQVPIVVCTLWGSQHIFHNGLRLKPTDVDFHVVGVLQPEDYKGMTAVEVGHVVHDMMAKDLGPEKVLSVEENP